MREKYAYLAGLFDGEGHVAIVRHQKAKHKTGGAGTWLGLRVVIRNRNLECLELPKSLFGGSIQRQQYKDKGWADSYRWQAYGRVAVAFMEAIKPYAIIKQPHIDAVLNNLEDKSATSELLRTFNQRGGFTGTQLPL